MQVVQQLEGDRAEHAAVEIAGAADHEHQQDVGAAVEVEHVERDEAAGLREQRAGGAGDAPRPACRRRPAAAAPTGRCSMRAGGCRAAPAATRRTASGRCAGEQQDDEQDDERVGVGGAARRGRTRSAEGVTAGPSTTPCRPSAPPVTASKRLASSYRIEATPSVTISRVRSRAAQDQHAGRSPSSALAPTADGQADAADRASRCGEQRRGVGAEAEEGGVAERDDAGVAEDQVERHGEQGDDGDLVEQQRVPRQQQPRERQRRQQRELPPAPARRRAARRRPATAGVGVLIGRPPARAGPAAAAPGWRSSGCRR